VIEVHQATLTATRWIVVGLNTTGHVAVAADIRSGKTIKKLSITLTDNLQETARNCGKNINSKTKKKIKSRERKTFKSELYTISRQIVSFAESLGSGSRLKTLLPALFAPFWCGGFP